MCAATRRPIPVLRRAVHGSLTAALLAGGALGLASPSAAAIAHPHEEPAYAGSYAVGGPWQTTLQRILGGRYTGPPGSWTRPVAPARVSASYGVRGDWTAGHHTGVDLAVPVGTDVRSVGSGKVVFAGRSGDYGKAVTIRMNDGHYTLFAHLSRIHVDEGDRVEAGTLIGESGQTGRTTGPHLHFEVRAERGYGSDVNPVAYLRNHGVHIT